MRPNDGRNTTTDQEKKPQTGIITCSCMGGGWCRVQLPWKGCGEALCKGELSDPSHRPTSR
jgi:hypothetical protein